MIKIEAQAKLIWIYESPCVNGALKVILSSFKTLQLHKILEQSNCRLRGKLNSCRDSFPFKSNDVVISCDDSLIIEYIMWWYFERRHTENWKCVRMKLKIEIAFEWIWYELKLKTSLQSEGDKKNSTTLSVEA